MIALLLGLVLTAHAEETHLVREGDTARSIAEDLGRPALAGRIRGLNELEPGEEPRPGTLLRLPDWQGRSVDLPAAVSSVVGQGTVQIGSAPPVALEVGAELPTGSEVCVEPTSSATLRLAYDPVTYAHDDVQLLPGACLRVTSSAAGAGRRASTVEVLSGTVAIRVNTGGSPGSVTVATYDGATSGERGGFRVSLEEDATRTEALEEQVVVIGAGQELVVEAGHGSRLRRGEAPSDPVPLLPSVELLEPVEGAVIRRPAFAWTSVPRALAYQVEIARIPDFTELVTVEQVPDTRWTPEVLFLPFRVRGLWWRVSAVDRTGFVGAPGEARYLIFPAEVGP